MVPDEHPLHIGDHAPDFHLYNTGHEQVSLHSFLEHGNVVLLFFPLAFTDVCTQELCSMRDHMATYSQLNAIIVGVSVDSMFALAKFKEEQHFQFDLLSDFNREVSRQYHVLHEHFPLFHMKNVSQRAAFVIDRQQTIQYAERLDDPGKIPNFDKIQETLKKCHKDS